MRPMERFFQKYFLSMAGIVVLFLLLNIVLLFAVLIWAWQTSEVPELSLNEVCDSIVMDETGQFTASEGLTEKFSREIMELVHENYGSRIPVFDKYIPLSVRAAETAAEGKSIFVHDPKGKVAAAYSLLAEEVLAHA